MPNNPKVPKARDNGSDAKTEDRSVKRVSPTSERIIKETSIKRRKAMEVLANR